jgi:NADH-quinone oxidoreductase subunit J
MNGLGYVFFYACAFFAVLGATGVVLAQNPIRGAMGLLMMILAIAGLFLALHAEFLAATQLIVYAGAIVVLFLFVIMLLGPSATSPTDNRGRISRGIGGVLFGLLGIGATVALLTTGPKAAGLLASPAADFGTVDAFGKIIFSSALVPFELSSALLMVAIVGAIAVARGHTKHELAHRAPGEYLRADDVPLADPEGAPRSPGGITREARS